MKKKINQAMAAAVILLASFTFAYANNNNAAAGRVPDFQRYGTFDKADAVLKPQAIYGQSTCMEAVPIVNATAADNFGDISRYTNQANIIYYDYFAPVGSIVDGFAYAGCQQFNDCMYDNSGSYMIMGRSDWSETCDWYNNFEDCETITRCTGEPVDSGDRMAFVLINPLNENTADHGLEFSISSVRGDDSFGGYNFDASEGTTHLPVTLQAMSVNSAVCDSYNCTFEVSIPNITFDASGNSGGLYGDDPMVAQNLIAGYKIYAMGSQQAPVSGKASDWIMTVVNGRYAGRTAGQFTTATVVVDVTSGSGTIYLSYAPVFNYNNACLTGLCTDSEVLTIDSAASGHLASPYVAPHSSFAEPQTEQVVFDSFTAKVVKNRVLLRWTTSLELNVKGFRLYRSNDLTGWTQINKKDVPASGNPDGASYSFVDYINPKGPMNYRIEAIGISGDVLAERQASTHSKQTRSGSNL